jgi:hypothetical protein
MESAEEILDKVLNNTFKLSTKNKLITAMEEYSTLSKRELLEGLIEEIDKMPEMYGKRGAIDVLKQKL